MNTRSRWGGCFLGLGACLFEQGACSRAFAQQVQTPRTALPAGQASPGQDPSAEVAGAEAEAAAAETNELGGLEALLGESVVTTASRSAERTSTAPSTVYAITANELRTFGIRTVAEALGFLGLGVYTASPRDFTQGIDVGAQGVLLRDRGRHILGLIDGHVMNSQATGGVSLNEAFGVPLEAIDHIEVMLGAGSVMYGANAMLLVVNIVTRRARDQQGVSAMGELGIAAPHEDEKVVGGDRVGLRYRAGVRGAATLGEEADVMISAEWLEDRSNSYKMGPIPSERVISVRADESEWGGRAHHRMTAPSGVLSARYRDFRLLMQANHYEREMPLVGLFQDPHALEKQDAIRGDLRHSADLGAHATLGSRLYADYHRFSEASSWTGFACLPGLESGCLFQMEASARWLGLEEQLVIDWFLDGTAATTVGFDLRGRRVESAPATYSDLVTGARLTSVPTPHAEREGFLGAVFAQQLWKPASWVTLNLGARFDGDGDFGGHLSPRAAITLQPADGTSIRASYSEAFRGPSRYELDELDPAYRLAPVSLKPEVVRVYELEWQQRLSLATFTVRGFGANFRDFIDTRPVTADEFAAAAASLRPDAFLEFTVVNDNLATISSYGASSSVVLRFAPGLQVGGSLNVSHARRDGEQLAVMPPVFGNARIAWQLVPDGVTIAATAIVTAKRRIIFDAVPMDVTTSPEFVLRTTLSGPTGISGLSFRGSLTYVGNSSLPYSVTLDPGATLDPSVTRDPPVLTPVTSRLYGFVGFQYDFEP